MRLRLLPIMIFFSLALLTVKLVDIVQGTRYFANWMVRPLKAETPSTGPNLGSNIGSTTTATTPNANTPASANAPESASKPSSDASKQATPDANAQEFISKKPSLEPAKDIPPGVADVMRRGSNYSEVEVELLQQLSKRRKELDKKEQSLISRENLLTATSSKVENRIAELKNLQEEVTKLIATYNGVTSAKLMSLVKIYEDMKPADAARIFEQLDMDVMLPVVDKMKEAKAALILAKMNPIKARDLTTELSNRRKIPQVVTDGFCGAH